MNNSYSKNNIKQIVYSLFPFQYFSYVATCLGQLINGFFIGNLLSSLDMAALGFYNPFQTIVGVFAGVVSSGARIVCGNYIGRGQKDKINETFSAAVYLLLIFGSITTICSIFFAPTIADLLGTSVGCFDLTVDYIRTMGLGLIPDMLSTCLIVFLQMHNELAYSLYAVILLGACSLLLDFFVSKTITFSIFVAGLLYSISKLIVFLFILIKFVKSKSLPKLTIAKDFNMYKSICKLGLPAGLFGLLVGIRNVEINKATLIYGGEMAVSGVSILCNTQCIYDGVPVAISTIITMLSSVYYGEKDRESIKQVFKTTVIFGELLSIFRILVIVLFTDKIALLYGVSPEVIQYTKYVYLFYGLAFPLNILVICYMYTYQSLGKTTYCNIVYFVTVVLINIFCCRCLSIYFGLFGIWFGYILQEITNLVIVFVYAWIKKKKYSFKLDDVLFLDDEINVGSHLTISINDIKDVMSVAHEIQKYCENEGVDKRRASLSGLCCEEISSNIIEHGFTKSKKRNKFIDIYCDVDDISKNVNIRIKDNAVSFDPHIKLQNNDDLSANVGIRLVSKIAKKMNYQNDFGLNVLTIEL